MKNITKRFFFYLLLLSQLILNAKPVDPCPLAILVTDLSTSGTEFKIIVKDSDGFDAWLVLNKEAPSLRTNLDELRLVSKNLAEIKNAGGYLKWKNLNTFQRHSNWVQVDDIIDKINLKVGHVIETLDLNSAGTKFKGCHSEISLRNYIANNPTNRYEFRDIVYDINSGSNNASRVFEAKPTVIKPDGTEIIKGNNQGVSSFFPQNWDKNKIIEEVEYAIANNHGRIPSNPNGTEYYGFSKDNKVEIHFYLNADGSIGSFFPKKR